MVRASPYNKRIHLSAGGRHGACLRKPRAGSASAAGLQASACAPSSQVIRVLYGQRKLGEKWTQKTSSNG